MKQPGVRIEEWPGAPQMETGAPLPGILCRLGRLYLAYQISNPESAARFHKKFAVVRFDGVLQHTFGYPNDEALAGHPLYSAGLRFYSFNEVVDSPYLRELGGRNSKVFPGTQDRYTHCRHWIVAFHDETLEVVADSVTFLGVERASGAEEAISRHAT